MDESLLQAFRASDYLVSIDEVQWACIRIDQPLPAALVSLVGDRPWGFITAWNPDARATRTPAQNLAAQRSLLAALRGGGNVVVLPGLGVADGWREPSLFAIGADLATLDTLARQYDQLAYVRGDGDGVAQLRVLQ